MNEEAIEHMRKYEMIPPKPDFTPEQRLWLAVVARAIADYGYVGQTKSRNSECNYSLHCRAAMFLFYPRKDNKVMSLHWIAEHLTDHPTRFVKCAQAMAKRMRATGLRMRFRHRTRRQSHIFSRIMSHAA